LLLSYTALIIFAKRNIQWKEFVDLIKDGELFFFTTTLAATSLNKLQALPQLASTTSSIQIPLWGILLLSTFCFGLTVHNKLDQAPLNLRVSLLSLQYHCLSLWRFIMSTDHESQSFYVENERSLKHAARLDKVYFMTYAVGIGLGAGTLIGLVLDMVRGTLEATGTGTIVGIIIGGLTGAIFLCVHKRRPDIELPAAAQGSDTEPPESI
jgi:hypothetical protein